MQNCPNDRDRPREGGREKKSKEVAMKKVVATFGAGLLLAAAIINLGSWRKATNGNKQNKRSLQQFSVESGAWPKGLLQTFLFYDQEIESS